MYNIHEDKIKQVDNIVCGKVGCINLATKRIIFNLGFTARFCPVCAKDFIKDGIGFEGIELKKEGQALDQVEGLGHNAILSTPSSEYGDE